MTEQNTPKRPSHIAYQVREGQEGQSYFNRVGSAFAHKDDQGFNIILDSIPVDGRITLRTPQERLADQRDGKASSRGRVQSQDREYGE